MYLCVRVRVCVCPCLYVCEEDVHEKRVKKEKKKRSENINLFIQINRQTDGRTDKHKSFIDMRYYTEQYSKSNSIE